MFADVVLPLLMHDRIAHVHLSPNGRHAFISTTGADNFYLNLKHDSAKQLKKLKVSFYMLSEIGLVELLRFRVIREYCCVVLMLYCLKTLFRNVLILFRTLFRDMS